MEILSDKQLDLMDQSPSWEADSSSGSQEIPHILWNPYVHYRIHERPLPVPIPSLINPGHTCPSLFLKIIFLKYYPTVYA